MIRAVIDSNVVAGAMITAGLNRQVLRACLTGAVRPLLGTALFLEYEDLVARAELFRRSPGFAAARDRLEFLAALASVSEWIEVYDSWRPNLRDEGDNHLMELAVAGAAQVIVTNNVRHLSSGELLFPSVRILRPGAFLQELK